MIEWESLKGRCWVEKIDDIEIGGRIVRRAFIRCESSPHTMLLPESEVERQILLDTSHLAWKKKRKLQEDQEQAELRSSRDEKRDLHGFTDGMAPIKARKIEETLDKQMSFNGVLMTRRDFIEKAVTSGATVELKPKSTSYSSRGEREIPSTRILSFPARSFFYEKDISKTAMDYAEYLSER